MPPCGDDAQDTLSDKLSLFQSVSVADAQFIVATPQPAYDATPIAARVHVLPRFRTEHQYAPQVKDRDSRYERVEATLRGTRSRLALVTPAAQADRATLHAVAWRDIEQL